MHYFDFEDIEERYLSASFAATTYGDGDDDDDED